MPRIPPELESYAGRHGRVGGLVQSLTVYLATIDVDQFDFLLNWYAKLCPFERIVKYMTIESQIWDSVTHPYLTKQGVAADAAGEQWPFVAPVRTRVLKGRPFALAFWDENDKDMFSLSVRQVRDEQRNLYPFVRLVLPLDAEPTLLLRAARELADNVEILSGYGGYSFGYATRHAFDAFTQIYPRARRYWGVDIESIDDSTLPLMQNAIKGIGWLTLLGTEFYERLLASGGVSSPVHPLVTQERRAHGILYRVGDAPSLGDIHRPSAELDAMKALGSHLADLVVQDHPSFSGDGFIDNANTNGWIHRFDDPSGWR